MNKTDELLQGKQLARNSLLNLLGYFTPMGVAAFTIPPLIRGIGTDRFGVLTLAWVIIGYLSLFDMGLSRALTKLVAEKLGADQEKDIPGLVWSAILLMGVMGAAVASGGTLLLPWLIQDMLTVPPALQAETLDAFHLLMLSLPLVIPSIGLRGVLDAYQRFDLTNAVRVTLGIYSFSAPLLVLPFSEKLTPMVGVLVAGRLTACLAHLLLCFRVVPSLVRGIRPQRKMAGPLIRFGGWMTVTNVISPLMIYLDRFLIGSILSVTAVAHYATPNEVVTKLWLFPGAVMGVLFPAFSTSFVQNRAHTAALFGKGVKAIFLVLFPASLMMITLAEEGLGFWLGSEFAKNSTLPLQWMTIGVFIHSLGMVPHGLIQGIGRPDLTAKLRFAELPVYLITLWGAISVSGILGAAIVWVVRITADTALMFAMVWHLLNLDAEMMWRRGGIMGGVILTLAVAMTLTDIEMKGVFLLLTLLIYVPSAWFLILSPGERMWMRTKFEMIFVRCVQDKK